jgi:hypothetical protein
MTRVVADQMIEWPDEAPRPNGGRRIYGRALAGIVLSCVLPPTVFAYTIQTYVSPRFLTMNAVEFTSLHALAFFVLLAACAGGYVVWDIARVMATLAAAILGDMPSAPPTRALDETRELQDSVMGVLTRAREQEQLLADLSARLEDAHGALENARQVLTAEAARTSAEQLRAVPEPVRAVAEPALAS